MFLQRLELTNFQSHEYSVMEFDANFNCIVGRSRAGKSSVVRALGFLLDDRWHDSYLRIGAEYASVKVTLSNGAVVERQKGPNTNKAILKDPQGKVSTFEKFGVDAPPEVKQQLQVFPVQIDLDYQINLNIADQDDAAFLLSETGPMKTKYLNRLTGTHVLDAALRSLNKDKLQATAEKQQCEKTIVQLNEKLLHHEKVDEVRNLLSDYQTKSAYIREKLDYLNRVTQLRASLVATAQRETKINSLVGRITFSKNVIDRVKVKYNKVQAVTELRTLIQKEVNIQNKLEENNQKLAKINVCPLCGNKFDAKVFMDIRSASV